MCSVQQMSSGKYAASRSPSPGNQENVLPGSPSGQGGSDQLANQTGCSSGIDTVSLH